MESSACPGHTVGQLLLTAGAEADGADADDDAVQEKTILRRTLAPAAQSCTIVQDLNNLRAMWRGRDLSDKEFHHAKSAILQLLCKTP